MGRSLVDPEEDEASLRIPLATNLTLIVLL
jgi:hypothetical protein